MGMGMGMQEHVLSTEPDITHKRSPSSRVFAFVTAGAPVMQQRWQQVFGERMVKSWSSLFCFAPRSRLTV